MEPGRGLLQSTLQLVSLVKNGQHCSIDRKNERTSFVPSSHPSVKMAEGTNSRNDDDRLKQENIDQESGGENGKELHRDGCGMISIKLDEFIFLDEKF